MSSFLYGPFVFGRMEPGAYKNNKILSFVPPPLGNEKAIMVKYLYITSAPPLPPKMGQKGGKANPA